MCWAWLTDWILFAMYRQLCSFAWGWEGCQRDKDFQECSWLVFCQCNVQNTEILTLPPSLPFIAGVLFLIIPHVEILGLCWSSISGVTDWVIPWVFPYYNLLNTKQPSSKNARISGSSWKRLASNSYSVWRTEEKQEQEDQHSVLLGTESEGQIRVRALAKKMGCLAINISKLICSVCFLIMFSLLDAIAMSLYW